MENDINIDAVDTLSSSLLTLLEVAASSVYWKPNGEKFFGICTFSPASLEKNVKKQPLPFDKLCSKSL